jgi:hypothetical protein
VVVPVVLRSCPTEGVPSRLDSNDDACLSSSQITVCIAA